MSSVIFLHLGKFIEKDYLFHIPFLFCTANYFLKAKTVLILKQEEIKRLTSSKDFYFIQEVAINIKSNSK